MPGTAIPAAEAGAAAVGRAAATAAPALTSLAGAAAALLNPITLLVVAVGAAVVAVVGLTRRANRQAQELSAFSAEIARANARAQVAAIRQQVRSAGTGGAEIARLVETQSRMSVAMTRILDLLQRDVLRILNPVLEWIARGVEIAADLLEYMVAIRDSLLEILAQPWKALDLLDVIAGNLAKIKTNTTKEAGDFLTMFLQEADLTLDDLDFLQRSRDRGGMPVAAGGFGPVPLP